MKTEAASPGIPERESRRQALFWKGLAVLAGAGVLAYAGIKLAQHYAVTQSERRFIDRAFSPSNSGWMAEFNTRNWARLAAASEDHRILAVRKSFAPGTRYSFDEIRFAHAVVGLDPTGRVSHRAALEISKSLGRADPSALRDWTVALRLGPADVPLATALLKRMNAESDAETLYRLVDAFVAACARLRAEDVSPMAAALTARMKAEKDPMVLAQLARALAGIGGKLAPKEALPGAAVLLNRITTDESGSGVRWWSEPLSLLSSRLDVEHARAMAAALTESIKAAKGDSAVSRLATAIGALAGKLKASELEPAVAAVTGRMQREDDSDTRAALGGALGGFVDHLNAQEVGPAAAALVERMKVEEDGYRLSALAEALKTLSEKLAEKDARLLAAALVERMKAEKNSRALSKLASALGGMGPKLSREDAEPLAAELLDRAKAEKNRMAFCALLESLGALKASPAAMEPLVPALAERVRTERDVKVYSGLCDAIAALSGSLDEKASGQIAAALSHRQATNFDGFGRPSLKALTALRAQVKSSELRAPTEALLAVLKEMAQPWFSSQLIEPFNLLAEKLDAKDAAPMAAALANWIEDQGGLHAYLEYVQAFPALCGHLDSKSAQAAATPLLERMKVETDAEALSALGEALASIAGKLRPEDARLAMNILFQAWKANAGQGISGKAWAPLEAAADRDEPIPMRLQKYVDLLALPLATGTKDFIDGLEPLTGQKFDGDLWHFVDWAVNSERGKAMHLNLDQRPP
jgi:hypothetical protein